jgi:hypothetical protein
MFDQLSQPDNQIDTDDELAEVFDVNVECIFP